MKDSSRSIECLVDVLKDDEGLADGAVAMEEHGAFSWMGLCVGALVLQVFEDELVRHALWKNITR